MAFRLEALLRYRRWLVEVLQLEVSVLRLSLDAATRRLQALHGRRSAALLALRRRQEEAPLDPHATQRRLRELERIGRAIQEQEEAMVALHGRLEQKQQALLERSQSKWLLERLEQQDRTRLRQRLRQIETKAMDESAQAGYLRQEEGG
ncbi:MAG: hypothetical protein HYY02_02135 [Chloroflexi bacterium]|nr:hypothetical protein [Chloroflexota bacterium]